MARPPLEPSYGDGFYPARDIAQLDDLLEYLSNNDVVEIPEIVKQAAKTTTEGEANQLRQAIHALGEVRQDINRRTAELRAQLDALEPLTRVLVERATSADNDTGLTQRELTNILQLSNRNVTAYRFDPLTLPKPE